MKKIGLLVLPFLVGCSMNIGKPVIVVDAFNPDPPLFWCCENGTCRYQPECNQIPGQENCAGTCHETRGDCYTDTDCSPE